MENSMEFQKLKIELSWVTHNSTSGCLSIRNESTNSKTEVCQKNNLVFSAMLFAQSQDVCVYGWKEWIKCSIHMHNITLFSHKKKERNSPFETMGWILRILVEVV